MIRILLTAILLIVTAVNISGQSKKPKSTLEIFDENLSVELEKLFLEPGLDRTRSILFCVPGNGEREEQKRKFLVSVIRKTADKNGLRYSVTADTGKFRADTSAGKVIVNSFVLNTTLPKFIKRKFLGERTLQRVISGSLALSVNDLPHSISFVRSDEIDYDEYESYASEEYEFTKAVPPGLSAFESVIFPVLLVGVSAAATILFFIIRTK